MLIQPSSYSHYLFYLLNKKTDYKTQSLQVTTILVSLGIKLSGLFTFLFSVFKEE